MRQDLVAGTANVIRFPKERRPRPTLQLVEALRPDVRQIDMIAEAFGLDQPVATLKDDADRRTAEYIAAHVPVEPVEARNFALDALLIPVLVTAIDACRAVHRMNRKVMEAQTKVVEAESRGSFQAVFLQELAEEVTLRAAEATLVAHARAEEAMGVARAVRIARCGEVWTPYDLRADEDALFGFSQSA